MVQKTCGMFVANLCLSSKTHRKKIFKTLDLNKICFFIKH